MVGKWGLCNSHMKRAYMAGDDPKADLGVFTSLGADVFLGSHVRIEL